MQNISEQLADIAISRSLLLQRVSNGLSKEVAQLYTEMIEDISTTILKSGKISNNMTKTIKDIKEQLQVPDIESDMNSLAQSEVSFTKNAYNAVIGVDIFKNIPPESAMAQIYNTSLIEGASIGMWLKDLEYSQAFDIERAVKLGMTMGETNVQLAKRLQSTMEVSMRNAQSIVITATSAVANKARMDFYESNSSVLNGYQWMATLDSRTRLEHAARDGAAWDLNGNGLNSKGKRFPFRQTPYGWRCRCQLKAILKSWRELGLDEDELPEGTRSSLDGYVPQSLSFDKWIENKPKQFQEEYLGKGRYELYRDGKITFIDLISQKGTVISIRELKEKYS